ncbi:MAG: hypothetical protein HOE90_24550 [Bacteriovoracaceae bacterium]|nr:hypothetical protein [Bacteriovoracaceae bacterium]
MSNLKMIVLDCPAANLHLPEVRSLYSKLMNLKLKGYETIESKYIPVDTSDLFATHFIVGEVVDGELNPLISFKGLTEERCNHWKIPFNGSEVVKRTKNKRHIKAVNNFFEYNRSYNGGVGYTASLAIDPNVGDNAKRIQCLKMFECMLSRFHTDFGIKSSMCIARMRVQSDKVLKKIGYEALKLKSEILPQIPFPQYIGDEFLILVLNNLSEEAHQLIEEFRSDWDERIVIAGHENNLFHIDNLLHQNGRKIA